MRTHTEQASWLPRVLHWNSGFSLLSGMTFVALATPLARVLVPQLTTVFGMALATWLRVVGLGLIGFAAALWAIARRRPLSRPGLWIITALDVAWVLGSILLLALEGAALTGIGRVIVADLALVVAVFAGLEILGLRRSHDTRGVPAMGSRQV